LTIAEASRFLVVSFTIAIIVRGTSAVARRGAHVTAASTPLSGIVACALATFADPRAGLRRTTSLRLASRARAVVVVDAIAVVVDAVARFNLRPFGTNTSRECSIALALRLACLTGAFRRQRKEAARAIDHRLRDDARGFIVAVELCAGDDLLGWVRRFAGNGEGVVVFVLRDKNAMVRKTFGDRAIGRFGLGHFADTVSIDGTVGRAIRRHEHESTGGARRSGRTTRRRTPGTRAGAAARSHATGGHATGGHPGGTTAGNPGTARATGCILQLLGGDVDVAYTQDVRAPGGSQDC
jgi:hypothetical protein